MANTTRLVKFQRSRKTQRYDVHRDNSWYQREQELELRLSEDENEVGDGGGQENENNVRVK